MPSDIIIRSEDRTSTSTSTTDFSIKLRNTMPIRRLRFKQIQIYYSWYPIDSSNNTGYINEGAADILFTVGQPTSWTGTDIATALQTALNAASSGYTVSYSTSTGKYTISRATAFTIKWATAANTLYLIFGFTNANTSSANSQTGANLGQTNIPREFQIRSNELCSGAIDRSRSFFGNTTFGSAVDTVVDNSKPIFINVPVDVQFGDLISKDQGNITREIEYSGNDKVINTIDIKVVNPLTGSALNGNGIDWTIVVEADFVPRS